MLSFVFVQLCFFFFCLLFTSKNSKTGNASLLLLSNALVPSSDALVTSSNALESRFLAELET